MNWEIFRKCNVLSSTLFCLVLLIACIDDDTTKKSDLLEGTLDLSDGLSQPSFKIATWVHGQSQFNDSLWLSKLKMYDSLGINDILVQASPAFLQQLIPIADSFGIAVHAWMWTLNQPGNKATQLHPDWYSVNRNGQNSLEFRPYVNYYQWLSPFHPQACAYIIDKVKSYCAVKGLASVHLDYIRYVDVILGADLQPKYKLVQDCELPEYDFGYHPIARKKFKVLFGIDPINMKHPELSTEWRQFRLNAVTDLVNAISDTVHQSGMHLTAAVFPFPEMSRQMVRQAWDDWHLDAAYPMLYHNFYRQNINWIGFAIEQGLRVEQFPIHAGLFVPALKDTAQLRSALNIAVDKKAKGLCLFTVDGMSMEQKKVLKDFAAQLKVK